MSYSNSDQVHCYHSSIPIWKLPMVQNRSELFGTGLKAEPNPWNQCILVRSGSVTFVVWFRFELVPNQTVATLFGSPFQFNIPFQCWNHSLAHPHVKVIALLLLPLHPLCSASSLLSLPIASLNIESPSHCFLLYALLKSNIPQLTYTA